MRQPQFQDTPGFVQDDICPFARMGTWVAETIRASGHVHRANRPDTRPLLTKYRSPQKCLALQEPSTQDEADLGLAESKVCSDLRCQRTVATHRQTSLPVFRGARYFTGAH